MSEENKYWNQVTIATCGLVISLVGIALLLFILAVAK